MDSVLVTGSSTGLGLETALYLAERGFNVFAAIRDLSRRDELLDAARERGVSLQVPRLDSRSGQHCRRRRGDRGGGRRPVWTGE